MIHKRALSSMRSLLLSSASGILLSSSIAQASPLLFLILLRSESSIFLDEVSEFEHESCKYSSFRELAVQCLSFLMLHIPDACRFIAESLLDPCSILFTNTVEFYHDRCVLAACVEMPEEPVTASLFNIERQNSIKALWDAYGDRQKAIIIIHAIDRIKTVAASAGKHAKVVLQLIASLINFMLRSVESRSSYSRGASASVLLCIELLIDQSAEVDLSSSFCLVAPVASWLHALARPHEVDWLAVSVACHLWTAAAASITSSSQSSIAELCVGDTSVSSVVEVAALALRRVTSMQPPEHVAADVAVAHESCSAVFRAISSTPLFASYSTPQALDFYESVISFIAQCHESLPLHIRCGALLRLQEITLDKWHHFTLDLKDEVLNAVHSCLFDPAASVYISAIEVLCSIGKVEPSVIFAFGSKFLSTNSSANDAVSKGNFGMEKNPPASRDLALCKVLDALGDAVRRIFISQIN